MLKALSSKRFSHSNFPKLMKAFPEAVVLVMTKRNGLICAEASYTSDVS
jgi:hypothetical protein